MKKRKIIIASISLITCLTFGLNGTFEGVKAESSNSTFEYGTFYNNETIFKTFSDNWASLENQSFVINSNSNVNWKINKARRAWSTKLQLISYNPEGTDGANEAKKWSFTNKETYPCGTDEYYIARAALSESEISDTSTILNGLYTLDYIDDIESIYASWEAGEGFYGYVRVLYKLNDSSWQLLTFNNGENTKSLNKGENELLCSGSRLANLKGKSARFAIVHLGFYYTHMNFIMKNIVINRSNSIADYMNVLSSKENTCALINDTSNYYGDTFNFLTSDLNSVDKTVLANYSITSSYSFETDALGLLNIYLNYVGKLPLNSNFIIKDSSFNAYLIALVIMAVTVSLSIASICLINKKRKGLIKY